MSGPSWLIDSKRIASKIKNASGPVDPTKYKWISNPTKECPRCSHIIDNSDVGHEWPGLPKGVKFDPSDQELLWHLLAKLGNAGVKPHPFIDEFIPTVDNDDGICYTHPQKLPGLKQDGSVSHFFHRTFKAYNTGTKKRRKINTDDLGDVRWHKTGKTKPVILDGKHIGCKKIMVLYMSNAKGGKPEKTNWVMHQYHLGTGEDEKDGEYVVSKLFYQQQFKPGEKNAQGLTTVDALESVAVEEDLLDCPPLVDCPSLPPEGHANSNQEAVQDSEHSPNQVNGNCEMKDEENIVNPPSEMPDDQDNHPSQDPKWWDGESQFLLTSQQLADGIAICDEFLQSQTSCGGGDEPRSIKSRLADYDQLTAEDLKRDLEECQKLDNIDNANQLMAEDLKKDLEECQKLDNIDNANLELENTPEFRLSQLEFSQDSFLTMWAGSKMVD